MTESRCLTLHADKTARYETVSAGVGNKGQSMGMKIGRRVALGLGVVLALSACEGTDPLAFLKPDADAPATTGEAAPRDGETRDVEAPDVFSETDAGLWDGRPSLGGVWVAYPDVPDPERVLIRNTENGSSVVGALFRRERDNPGPRFQISSDAAESLNILAGAPTRIEVVALTREVVATPPPADAASAPDASDGFDPALDAAAAIEAAELDAPAAAPTATPAPAPSPLSRPYIQIGIFSVEANAKATEAQMRAAGLAADTFAQQSQGKPFFRVIVGPAQSEATRAAALETVKSLGFADAYFVTN
jgi:cell division septation protein DedD